MTTVVTAAARIPVVERLRAALGPDGALQAPADVDKYLTDFRGLYRIFLLGEVRHRHGEREHFRLDPVRVHVLDVRIDIPHAPIGHKAFLA